MLNILYYLIPFKPYILYSFPLNSYNNPENYHHHFTDEKNKFQKIEYFFQVEIFKK